MALLSEVLGLIVFIGIAGFMLNKSGAFDKFKK